jgi:hypothetical protein
MKRFAGAFLATLTFASTAWAVGPGDVEVSIENITSGTFKIGIVAKLVNRSGEPISSVTVQCLLKDEKGTALDLETYFVHDVEPGATKYFKVPADKIPGHTDTVCLVDDAD